MRIVQIIRDCFDTMPNLTTFIPEERSRGNEIMDNEPSPALLLDRPINMPFRYVANNVEEVYDILLVYAVYNDNTQLGNDQMQKDIEIEAMRIEAKRMLLNLDKHPEVKSVEVAQPMIDYSQLFNVLASGIIQYLRITLMPMSPDVCASYNPDIPAE